MADTCTPEPRTPVGGAWPAALAMRTLHTSWALRPRLPGEAPASGTRLLTRSHRLGRCRVPSRLPSPRAASSRLLLVSVSKTTWRLDVYTPPA